MIELVAGWHMGAAGCGLCPETGTGEGESAVTRESTVKYQRSGIPSEGGTIE